MLDSVDDSTEKIGIAACASSDGSKLGDTLNSLASCHCCCLTLWDRNRSTCERLILCDECLAQTKGRSIVPISVTLSRCMSKLDSIQSMSEALMGFFEESDWPFSVYESFLVQIWRIIPDCQMLKSTCVQNSNDLKVLVNKMHAVTNSFVCVQDSITHFLSLHASALGHDKSSYHLDDLDEQVPADVGQ